jgi:hypothetical protein
LGNDGNKDEAFEFALKTFVNGMGFQQAIVGVGVEIDGDGIFDRG